MQLTHRYDRTQRVPRDVLASVVDDFNSGNPELVRGAGYGLMWWYCEHTVVIAWRFSELIEGGGATVSFGALRVHLLWDGIS